MRSPVPAVKRGPLPQPAARPHPQPVRRVRMLPVLFLLASAPPAAVSAQRDDATRCRTLRPSVSRVVACRAAIRQRPDDGTLWVRMGWAFDSLGYPRPSRRAFERAVALAPGNVEALTGLAKSGADSADAYPRRAPALEPANAVVHNLIGSQLLSQRGLRDSLGRARAATAPELERLGSEASWRAWLGVTDPQRR